MILTSKKVEELVNAGKQIYVKVTPDTSDGLLVVNIRDHQFKEAVDAQMYLEYIAKTEVIGNSEFLIG